MDSNVSISFNRKDSIPKYIEQATKDIADHFKSRRGYIPQFCSMVQNSKRWNMRNITSKLQSWKQAFSRIAETGGIIRIIESAFSNCNTDKDIHKLRGAIVEGLIIGCHGGSVNLAHDNYGWGAQVIIKKDSTNQEVKYVCTENKHAECGRRMTVDFGYWNGKHGKFYECKVQPEGIGCKEIMYMRHLADELAEHSISHEMLFVSACPSDDLKIRLEEWGLSPRFKAIGTSELKEMMRAS
ncbi:hypothetical protein [Priestia aryabhattai]|uniref:hypothetical protein n=1 Tax=Priestia aryabhattai TaxID=412384 RepID=UPI0031014995